MSRFTKDSKFRLRDFEKRGRLDKPLTHSSIKMEYITVHSFENKIIDVYWNQVSDVCFLQVECVKNNDEVGMFARWPKDKKMYLNLVSRIKTNNISRDTLESEMYEFIKRKYIATEELRNKLNSKLIRI